MRRALIFLTALALAGCHPTPGPVAATGSVATETGSLQLTLRVPPEALPGYQTATIPGGSATIFAMLSNAALLGAPRSVPVTLVGGQSLYTVTMAGLPVGAGYTFEAEARNGSGARLAYTNQLDPASLDPALGQLRAVNPFTNPPQTFSITSGMNTVNAGLRILALSGTTAGSPAGSLTGNAGVMTGYKRHFSVHSSNAVPAGYVATLTLNTATLVTGTKLRADMKDLHVLYWDGARYLELYRDAQYPNTASTQIRFRLQKAIWAAGSDAKYVLTYGNNLAAPAPSDPAQVYDFFDGFEYATSEIANQGWNTIRGSGTVSTAAGQGRTGNALNLNSTGGDFNRDVTRYFTLPTNFSMVAWFKDDLDASRHDWIAPVVGYNSNIAIGISTEIAGSNYHYIAGGGWLNSPVARTAAWHRFEFQRNNGTMTYMVDASTAGTAAETRAFKAITIRSGIPWNAGYTSNVYWDDISVRPLVSPEPTVTLGAEAAL